jgi:hypothetical protein
LAKAKAVDGNTANSFNAENAEDAEEKRGGLRKST